VEAGAERAVDDPTAIAYVGEVDPGASAVSLPVTNRAGLLQVSPTDGLTSLTTEPPGRPRAGPERYYPEGKRTFERMVPTDLRVADAMLERVPPAAGRSVAVIHTEGFAERELAGVLAFRMRSAKEPALLVEPLRGDQDAPRSLVHELIAKRPGAILFAAQEGRPARVLLRELAISLPSVPVVAGPGLATARPGRVPNKAEAVTGLVPGRLQPTAGRRLLRSLGTREPQALYGYEAMSAVLEAIEAAGPDRAAVTAAALRAPRREGVVRRSGLALVDLSPQVHDHEPACLLRRVPRCN
jgi:branched-chain amino acid transport system substrate-binding protein